MGYKDKAIASSQLSFLDHFYSIVFLWLKTVASINLCGFGRFLIKGGFYYFLP